MECDKRITIYTSVQIVWCAFILLAVLTFQHLWELNWVFTLCGDALAMKIKEKCQSLIKLLFIAAIKKASLISVVINHSGWAIFQEVSFFIPPFSLAQKYFFSSFKLCTIIGMCWTMSVKNTIFQIGWLHKIPFRFQLSEITISLALSYTLYQRTWHRGDILMKNAVYFMICHLLPGHVSHFYEPYYFKWCNVGKTIAIAIVIGK